MEFQTINGAYPVKIYTVNEGYILEWDNQDELQTVFAPDIEEAMGQVETILRELKPLTK